MVQSLLASWALRSLRTAARLLLGAAKWPQCTGLRFSHRLYCDYHELQEMGALTLAARRSDCGGWPKARMKARRIRSGSRKPAASATRSIDSDEDCTRARATSMRRRSIALDGVVPVSEM